MGNSKPPAALPLVALNPGPEPSCQPWCTDHRGGGIRPKDGYCLGVVPTPAGDLLLGDDDGRPVLLLHRLRDINLTLDQGRTLYAALGELLAAAPQGELVGGVL